MQEEERRKREKQRISSYNNPVGFEGGQIDDDLRRLHRAQANKRNREAQEELRRRAARKRRKRRIRRRKRIGAAVISLTMLCLLTFGAYKGIMGIIHYMSLKSGQSVAELSTEPLTEGQVEGETETERMEEDDTAGTPEEGTEALAQAVNENGDLYIGELPDIDINSWEYILVNAEHTIGDYEPELASYGDVQMDARILDAMTSFLGDAEAEDLPVYISCAYRDYDTQEYLYQRKISQGYSEEEAATIVAPPGTSEHQTGLAADITDVYRETKDSTLAQTATYQWMSAHCQEYGFVVRYPEGKEDITGIIYEPWHFRYVGVEAATFMMENNLCLEEFVALYQ